MELAEELGKGRGGRGVTALTLKQTEPLADFQGLASLWFYTTISPIFFFFLAVPHDFQDLPRWCDW